MAAESEGEMLSPTFHMSFGSGGKAGRDWHRAVAIIGLVLVLVASCSAPISGQGSLELTLPSGERLFFPRQLEPDLESGQVHGTPLALFPGSLILHGDCLALEDMESGNIFVLIWPPDFVASISQANEVQVIDSSGSVVGVIGDEIVLFGGETKSLEGFDPILSVATRELVEERCPGAYLMVGGVHEGVGESN